ncbi:lipopolysaccharide assembly protein LapA domain-containing protein [Paenibacillus sp.]|uniref:LapA family protein n=1 Tax=Paenibacillus sp. TaxID=58172 RepID=UPI0028121D89|nr:lipopolysaccharide assembly protein LapA domain-containing protein [Paenibacillus sp.]
MKQQWTLIFGLLFALVIAVFSVVNVESVPVDYVFGSAFLPLILVILGSALAGGFVVGLFGTIRIVRLSRRIRALERELQLSKDLPAAPAAASPDAPSAEAVASAGDDTK